MKRVVLRPTVIIILLSILGYRSFSQYYYYNNSYYDNDLVFELGAGIGGMNCITDLGGSKSKNSFYINEVSFKNTRLNSNFYVGALYRNLIGVTLQATYGSVQASDSVLKEAKGASRARFQRNLSFRSSIREISLLTEFHPLSLQYRDNGPPIISPYVLAGLSWFSFNPQANLNGQWVDLRPLSTEGQGFPEHKDRRPYRLSQSNVPLGVGLKLELSPLFNLRGEFIHRVLFTDYLDDVSTTYIDPSLFDQYLPSRQAGQARALYNRSSQQQQQTPGTPRGGQKSNDAYMSINVKVGMVLGRERKR